jgi:hypothetical protein
MATSADYIPLPNVYPLRLSLDMFKKILNIFTFLSHCILFNISSGLLHLFSRRPSEFDFWPLHPTLFLSFCMELHVWVTSHSRTCWHCFFYGAFLLHCGTVFLWRFLFCTVTPFFSLAQIFSPMEAIFLHRFAGLYNHSRCQQTEGKNNSYTAMVLFDLNMEQPFEGGFRYVIFLIHF